LATSRLEATGTLKRCWSSKDGSRPGHDVQKLDPKGQGKRAGGMGLTSQTGPFAPPTIEDDLNLGDPVGNRGDDDEDDDENLV
jgi:hypothetical protein